MFLCRRVQLDPTNQEASQDLYLLDHICQTSTTFSETFNFSLEYGSIKSEIREPLLDFGKNQTTNNSSAAGRKITDLLQDVSVTKHNTKIPINTIFETLELQ